MSLYKPINWNIENPFNLTIAKLNKVNGILNKNFPPTASIIAKINKPKKMNFLKFFDIFLNEVLATNLSKK